MREALFVLMQRQADCPLLHATHSLARSCAPQIRRAAAEKIVSVLDSSYPRASGRQVQSEAGRLTIKLDRLHDLAQVVRHNDGAVGEAGAADAAAAKDFVELLLVGRVISDGGRGVLELVAREDADDAFIRADHALIAQQPSAGDAGSAGRLAAKAAGGDLGLGVEHFLIADVAHDALHLFERPQALPQVDRPVDFDRTGNCRGFATELIQLGEVVVGDAHSRTVHRACRPRQR